MRFGPQLRRVILASQQLHNLVDRQLRRNVQEMAFLAMQTARARIVVRTPTGKHKRGFRYINGVRTTVNRTPGGRRSLPGESPTNQFKVLKHSIIYEWSRSKGSPIESIVGPKALTGHKTFTNGIATRALEHGGETINHQGQRRRIAARPFMAPSNPVVVANLAAIWANSITARGQVVPRVHSITG